VSPGTERTLVLVRHAESAPRADRPASAWGLTERGRAQAAAAAARIGAHAPRVLASSPEPKAVETARRIADALGLETRAVPGLEEHARETAPFLADPDDFRRAVLGMLARPDERVFGEESADECLARFRAALDGLMATQPGNVAVVTHGTVMSLWLEPVLGIPASDVWRSLGFCGFAALAWPSRRPLERHAGA